MPHASSLPEQLRDLQPSRKKFASRAPEKLNEGTGEKSRTEVAMMIRWKGTLTAIDSVSEEAAADVAEAEQRSDGASKLAIVPVRFGEASGTKFVRTGDSWRGPLKDVRYLLAASGGHVYIFTAVVGKKLDESKWDETQLEACFHTLRVVRKHRTD